MVATDASHEAINARSIADNMNAHDPHHVGRAAGKCRGRATGKGRPVRAQAKVIESELGR